jgi:hypothetical protein
VKWELRKGLKADPSLKSFLLTLKNPHNLSENKFALKAKEKDQAIKAHSTCGPDLCDSGVSDHCNANRRSHTRDFGGCYSNSTGVVVNKFFAVSSHFTVKEIEMVEIIN